MVLSSTTPLTAPPVFSESSSPCCFRITTGRGSSAVSNVGGHRSSGRSAIVLLLREVELEEERQVVGELDRPVLSLGPDQIQRSAVVSGDRGQDREVLVSKPFQKRGADQ